jgi:hypothetical protein
MRVDGRVARFLGDTNDREGWRGMRGEDGTTVVDRSMLRVDGRAAQGWALRAQGCGGGFGVVDCGRGWKRLRPRMERRRTAGAAGGEIVAGGRRGVAADLARRIAAADGNDCGGGLRGLCVEKSRRASGGQNRPCVDAYTKNI